jgi:hypothetical protein
MSGRGDFEDDKRAIDAITELFAPIGGCLKKSLGTHGIDRELVRASLREVAVVLHKMLADDPGIITSRTVKQWAGRLNSAIALLEGSLPDGCRAQN